MTCRTCGATIDAKAIICYRCGAPTADASVSSRGRGRPALNPRLVVAVLAAIALVVYLVIHFAGGK